MYLQKINTFNIKKNNQLKLMIIQSNQDLEKFCKLASRKKVLFIDTEFDRRNTYYSELSFISIYDGTKFWLIDCLTGIKVEALSKVLNNKKLPRYCMGLSKIWKFLNTSNYP